MYNEAMLYQAQAATRMPSAFCRRRNGIKGVDRVPSAATFAGHPVSTTRPALSRYAELSASIYTFEN